MFGPGSLERGQEVGEGACLVGDERAPDEGALAEVHGGGHLWRIRARAWQGRQWFWRSQAVDLGQMNTEKCREDGGGVVDWPPGRPQLRGLFEIFFLWCFFRLFFGLETGVFGGSFLALGEAGGGTLAGA